MNMQEFLDKKIQDMRNKSMGSSDQITLGELIKKLEVCEKHDSPVSYDFGYMHPTEIDSWRGSYSELALNYTESDSVRPVSEWITMLKECIGKTFEGYKGGEYLMSESTPIWVANYGQSGSTGIVDVLDRGYEVILLTAYTQY